MAEDVASNPVHPVMASVEPPQWLIRLSGWSWRFLVIAAAMAVVISVLSLLGVVIIPVFVGLLFTAALLPLVRRLRRRGAKPALAAAIGVLLILVGTTMVTALAVATLAKQAPAIANLMDEGVDRLADAGVDASLLREDQAAEPSKAASDTTDQAVGFLLGGVTRVVSTLASVVTILLLSIFVTFFLLKDGNTMWQWCVLRLGGGSALFDSVGRRSFDAIGGYIRGTAIVSAIDSVLISLGAWVLGVEFVVAIAVLTFVLAFIPYFGAVMAGLFAALLAVAQGGPSAGVAMLAIVLVVQQLEGNLLSPMIVGKATALHPLVIVFAAVGGGAVAGFLGIFAAVPLTAAVVAALSELRQAGFFGSAHAQPKTT